MHIFRRLPVLLFCFLLGTSALLSPAHSQDAAPTVSEPSASPGAGTDSGTPAFASTRWFKIHLDSKATMKIQGQTQQIDADTTVGYHRDSTANDKQVEVGLDAINVKASVNGQVQIDSFQSKDQLTVVQGDQSETVLAKDAEADLKEILSDTFEHLACRLTTDEQGEVVSNESLLRPGAQSIQEQGIVANILFFHAPFSAGKESWKSTRELSMGNGGFVKGELTYTPASKSGTVHVVNVSGKLKNPLFQP
ncbi:MAG: hypothetical protein ACR2NZ_07080, partial [Rubripirellula sp.]